LYSKGIEKESGNSNLKPYKYMIHTKQNTTYYYQYFILQAYNNINKHNI